MFQESWTSRFYLFSHIKHEFSLSVPFPVFNSGLCELGQKNIPVRYFCQDRCGDHFVHSSSQTLLKPDIIFPLDQNTCRTPRFPFPDAISHVSFNSGTLVPTKKRSCHFLRCLKTRRKNIFCECTSKKFLLYCVL